MGYHAIQTGINKRQAQEARAAGRSGCEGLKEILYPVKPTLRDLGYAIKKDREAFKERREANGDIFNYETFLVFNKGKVHGSYTLCEDSGHVWLKRLDHMLDF